MDGSSDCSAKLSKEEIGRYGRQLILPEWGVKSERYCQYQSVIIATSHSMYMCVCRSTAAQVNLSFDSWCGWSGLSCCSLSSCSWYRWVSIAAMYTTHLTHTSHSHTHTPHTGHVGLLDYDSVELSNLHRQVLHTEQRVGVQKAESAKLSIHG